jgi:hypothetical protein
MPPQSRRPPSSNRSNLSREEYAIEYLGKKFGLSKSVARDLIEQHGTDIDKLRSAAKRLDD